MKRILFFLFVFCAIKYSNAQSLSPQVITSAGNSFTDGTNRLDWTLGESVTSTLNNSNNLLTQGFHQGNLSVTSVDDFDTNYAITLFPNPTIDVLQIQFYQPNENNIIELYTLDGKLLLSQSSNYKTLFQIDMTSYTSGTYLLKIQNKNTQGKVYQIVKLK